MTEGTLRGPSSARSRTWRPSRRRAGKVDYRANIYAFGLILRDLLVGRRRRRSRSTISGTHREGAAPLRIGGCQPPGNARRHRRPDARRSNGGPLPDDGRDVRAAGAAGRRGPAAARPRRVTWRSWRRAWRWWPRSGRGVWLIRLRLRRPPTEHEPVSVVIADIRNGPATPLRPYAGADAQNRARGCRVRDRVRPERDPPQPRRRPPETLDERAAQEIAVRQGLGVVLRARWRRRADVTRVSLKAIQAVTGNVIADVRKSASEQDQVLGVATNLAADVGGARGRDAGFGQALRDGDTVGHVAGRRARNAAAAEAMSRSNFAEACEHFTKSVTLDPNFGLGYAGMAIRPGTWTSSRMRRGTSRRPSATSTG